MYCVFYWLVRAFFRMVFRVEIRGLEHLPRGPAIVACNHISGFDPPLLGSLLPRPAWYMTKAELFRIWGLSWLIRRLHAFPVRRGHPDRAALMQSLRILNEGGILIIFPEGHRSPDGGLQDPRRGTAFLAQKSGAPVVPVGLVGPYGFRRRVTFRMGPAFHIDPGTSVDEGARRIMAAIAEQIASIREERGLAASGGKV